MRKRVFVAAALAVCIMALVLVYGMVVMPSSTNTAYAAELAQKSSQAVSRLAPEQQGELKNKLQVGDPRELLERAKNAKDLKVLTYDELAAQYPGLFAPPPSEGKAPDLRGMKFLRFTDADGSTVVLGIDANNDLPAFVTVSNTASIRGSQAPGAGQKGGGFATSNSDGTSASFVMSDGSIIVKASIDANGKATFNINGKNYTAPMGAKFSFDPPPAVKIEGNDVYINGIKLIPDN